MIGIASLAERLDVTNQHSAPTLFVSLNGSQQFGERTGADCACAFECELRSSTLRLDQLIEKGGQLVLAGIHLHSAADQCELSTGVASVPDTRNGSAKISELPAPAKKVCMRAASTICGLPHR